MQLRNVWRAAGVKSIFERFNERERDMVERGALLHQPAERITRVYT